jgi:hypothetical protein
MSQGRPAFAKICLSSICALNVKRDNNYAREMRTNIAGDTVAGDIDILLYWTPRVRENSLEQW